ncbi:MAG: hypothetical protein NC489_33930 [Ruminococcus flavefaciens]|nr:hypothetical protein [Ruminococcus flavefaciens]
MLNYDRKKVRILSISRGFVSSKGNFAAAISDEEGAADIIWNHTEDVKIEEGSLFFITAEKLSDELMIELSFSQADTFDEKYEDVCLQCKKVEMKNSTQAKTGNEKLVESEEIKQKDTNQPQDELPADTAETRDDSNEADYGSHAEISSEEDAEKNAVSEYVQNKQKQNSDIPADDVQLGKDGSVLKNPSETEQTDDTYRSKENGLSAIRNFIVAAAAIIILVPGCIVYKKYVTKNVEDKDEKED